MVDSSRGLVLAQALAATVRALLVLSGASWLSALAFEHLGTGLGFVVLLGLMVAAGAVTAGLGKVVFRLEDAPATVAVVLVVVALLPGAPALVFARGGMGETVHARSAAEMLAHPEARYFHVDPHRLDPARAHIETSTGRAKGDSADTTHRSFLTPFGGDRSDDAPRVFLLQSLLHGTKELRGAEAEARKVHAASIQRTGPWFRRTDDGARFAKELAASPPPLVVTSIDSAEEDRSLRSLWVIVVTGLTALGVFVGTLLAWPRPASASITRHPYR